MPTQSLPSEDVYLQRHAALMITNRRLLVGLAILGATVAALACAVVAVGHTVSSFKPFVIRINDVGHAEAVTYQAMEYTVQEAEIKYFLMDFMSRYYGRVRGAAKDDLARSLYFLSPRLANQRLAEIKQDKSYDDFLMGAADQIEVNVDQISIEDLRQQPYKATVTFTKSYYSQLDHNFRGRDKFTAHVQFIVMDKVPHNLIPLNPLGLTITYLRDDQAFGDGKEARPSSPVPAAVPQAVQTPSTPGSYPSVGYPQSGYPTSAPRTSNAPLR